MIPVVTFDVFSALTDSRSGGSAQLQSVAKARGWAVSGVDLYDRWDATNKQWHRAIVKWAPFAEVSAQAMRETLTEFSLPAQDAGAVSSELLDSMAAWPLWTDVSAAALSELGASALGLLSNIDDGLLAGTAAKRLGVFDDRYIVTSERVRAYKPSAELYARATELIGPFVHIASSARDVRGALSAGIRCVRLARSGHSLDAAGPVPPWTANSVPELRELLDAAAGGQPG